MIAALPMSHCQCLLPRELQHRIKLVVLRQGCMNLNLWKDYSTSTDAERDAHLGLRKFHMCFQ